MQEKRKKCKYCGKEIIYYGREPKCCGSKECRNARNREWYNRKTEKCICKICGVEYEATANMDHTMCPKCKKENRPTPKWKTFKQNIICCRCGKIIKTVDRKITNKIVLNMSDNDVCDECRQKSKAINKEKRSEYLKLNNADYIRPLSKEEYEKQTIKEKFENSKRFMASIENVNLKDFEQKYSYELYRIEELKYLFNISGNTVERLVDYLGITRHINKNNYKKAIPYKPGKYVIDDEELKNQTLWFNAPCKDPKIKEKALEIRRINRIKKAENGPTVKKTNISRAYRYGIEKWRENKLKESGYKCSICGATGVHLNVHHLESFRLICFKICGEYGIKPEQVVYKSKEFYDIRKLIAKYHEAHPEIGIVVCEKCHKEIDKYFKKWRDGVPLGRKKNEDKKNL